MLQAGNYNNHKKRGKGNEEDKAMYIYLCIRFVRVSLALNITYCIV
jgi:hypothetical protein